MSLLKKFLGIALASDGAANEVGTGNTRTVQRISAELERLDADQARYLAAFAYILARVAHADLDIDDAETAEMERVVGSLGELDEVEARLVCSLARDQADALGGSENYLVTREFRSFATREQRAHLLECLCALAAADGTISSAESNEVLAIGEELGFARSEAIAIRSRWKEHLAELRKPDS